MTRLPQRLCILLFMNLQEDFGALLLALPIDVRVVMYTEGGSLAGLFLRTPVRSQIWLGRSLPEFWASGSQGAPLPNVIGVRRKS